MSKKKTEKKPYIPPIEGRTVFSRNLLPKEVITVDGPAAIMLKGFDNGQARLVIYSEKTTTIVHLTDNAPLFEEGADDE